MAATLLKWVSRAVDLVYPRNCQFCETPLTEEQRGVICPVCLALAKPIEPPFCRRCALPFDGKLDDQIDCGYCQDLKFHFTRAFAACRAEGVVRDCIHRLKYDRQMFYVTHLAAWLAGAGQRWIDWTQVDAIVPVPLHPLKERSREFNQAEVLARELSRTVGRPLLAKSVRRVKPTKTQTRLDAKSRRENMRGAFAARDTLAGQRLVLVDDVFTTGATLDACANVLLSSGATNVIALTVARGV
ncbi:MAG: ComF family protein [Verrucomicrobiota bacterium]